MIKPLHRVFIYLQQMGLPRKEIRRQDLAQRPAGGRTAERRKAKNPMTKLATGSAQIAAARSDHPLDRYLMLFESVFRTLGEPSVQSWSKMDIVEVCSGRLELC